MSNANAIVRQHSYLNAVRTNDDYVNRQSGAPQLPQPNQMPYIGDSSVDIDYAYANSLRNKNEQQFLMQNAQNMANNSSSLYGNNSKRYYNNSNVGNSNKNNYGMNNSLDEYEIQEVLKNIDQGILKNKI